MRIILIVLSLLTLFSKSFSLNLDISGGLMIPVILGNDIIPQHFNYANSNGGTSGQGGFDQHGGYLAKIDAGLFDYSNHNIGVDIRYIYYGYDMVVYRSGTAYVKENVNNHVFELGLYYKYHILDWLYIKAGGLVSCGLFFLNIVQEGFTTFYSSAPNQSSFIDFANNLSCGIVLGAESKVKYELLSVDFVYYYIYSAFIININTGIKIYF